jgi:hypothetical protein
MAEYRFLGHGPVQQSNGNVCVAAAAHTPCPKKKYPPKKMYPPQKNVLSSKKNKTKIPNWREGKSITTRVARSVGLLVEQF